MNDSQINDDIKEIKTTVNNYLPTADHLDRKIQEVLYELQNIKHTISSLEQKVNNLEYKIQQN